MAHDSSQSQRMAAADFGRTRWSVVAAVRDGGESDARRSLSELCRRYWVPVYAWVRRCGHPPQGAAALVQAFLSHVVHEIRDGNPEADAGFRVFLQRQLEQFLASDWTQLHTSAPLAELAAPWPLEEIEQRQKREPLAQLSPHDAFQRAFAMELLAQAFEQLRDEAERGGRGAMFAAVRPYLTREPAAGEYAQLAQRLGSSPLATVVAVKRLRQRYQELVDEQLAQTVGNPAAFEAERAALLGLLADAPAP
jgi:RNA polymerase sigma-70 factor (ECF subfamily)